MKYAVVIEKTESNFSAFVPDLPGCVATGSTRKDVEDNIRQAIEFHIESIKQDGEKIPQANSSVEYIEVAA